MKNKRIKKWIKEQLHKHNILVERFDKTNTKEQAFSCLVRLDRSLIGKRLFGVKLGLFGQWKNAFNFWLDEAEDGGIDLRYLVRDNGFAVEGSMKNGYGKEFIQEGDIVKLQINLYRTKDKQLGAEMYVRHPARDDSRRVEFLKGYCSTGFTYHLKADPKYAIARMTKLGNVSDSKGINYTKE